jgi:hypothetical protein
MNSGVITVLVVFLFICGVIYLVTDALKTIERQQQQKEEKLESVVISKPVSVPEQKPKPVVNSDKGNFLESVLGMMPGILAYLCFGVFFILLVWAIGFSIIYPGLLVFAGLFALIADKYNIDGIYAFLGWFVLSLLFIARTAHII